MKLRTLLMLAIASLCSWQGAWAERVAPVEPEIDLVNGGNFYLYNVGKDAALLYPTDEAAYYNYRVIPRPWPTKVTINRTDEGFYTIKLTEANRYFYHNSSYIYTDTSNKSLFKITKVEGGYTIQLSPDDSYYKENEYLGFRSTSDDYTRFNETTNIIWKILPAEDESFEYYHYVAKYRLYNQLLLADEKGYGCFIDSYEAIYENETSTNEELNTAANILQKSVSMSAGYQAPWWNERPILFYTADGNFGQGTYYTWALPNNSYTSGSYFYRELSNYASSSISATVLVEEPSTLVYGTGGYVGGVTVYVDGVSVRSLPNSQFNSEPSSKTHARFFEELEPGLHTITWTYKGTTGNYNHYYLYDVSVMSKPQITVSLLEPGSLGTEVLYNTDHIKNVRRLKVKGAMNSDDWGRIKMMSTLLELDLSEAKFTNIPASQFKVSSSDTTMNFLHKVVLPEGLTTIGDEAFYDSFVEDINLPSTMKRVGRYAFYRSHVRELIMPDDMTDFYGGDKYGYCFYRMYWLKKLVLPKNLTRIPNYTFNYGYYITEAVMPEKLQTVGEYAFQDCCRMKTILPEGLKTVEKGGFYNCDSLRLPLPETLNTIEKDAFRCIDGFKSLVIPQSVTSIGEYAFADCPNLEKVELSVYQYSLASGIFQDCSKLDTVKLKSPTVATLSGTYPLSDITKVVLQVPHYLVNSYKLHSYWYNAKAIEPFDYSDTEFIPISGQLTLNHERFGGQPSIEIRSFDCYLKINGDNEQKFNNIKVNVSGSSSVKGQLLNNCDNITAIGDNYVSYGSDAKKWHFISLPFDLDVSRITPDNGVQYAIRYYDGESRAANGKSGNWKNVDRNSIIPAGTGFIFQTNNSSWTWFYAADTENKYGTLRTTEFNKTLAVNASETASNRGWNLVGNPYQCFYNNHCLNFTAPITVWNGSTYVAYSLTDDDYAIRPNEAFFVQCPNEENATLGFPIQGRQLTSVIESQNAARAEKASARKLIDVELSDGELTDKTRFVMNPQAEIGYELNRDASKFFSMDASAPQIYTIENGELLAINERPLGEGTVQMGIIIPKDGTYTINAPRNQFQNIVLVDNETGIETLLADGVSYTFTADKGTHEGRFVLRIGGTVVTDINAVEGGLRQAKVPTAVYTLDGRKVADFDGRESSLSNSVPLQKGVYIVNGKKVLK